MAFGSKVHDGAGTKAIEKIGHQSLVQDAAFDESMAGIMLDVDQVGLAARVCQGVERQNAFVVRVEPLRDEV